MQAASEPTPQLLQQQQRFLEILSVETYAYIIHLLSQEKQILLDKLDIRLRWLGLDICSNDEPLTNTQQRPILPRIDYLKPRRLCPRTPLHPIKLHISHS
jgi:hypothetical protein